MLSWEAYCHRFPAIHYSQPLYRGAGSSIKAADWPLTTSRIGHKLESWFLNNSRVGLHVGSLGKEMGIISCLSVCADFILGCYRAYREASIASRGGGGEEEEAGLHHHHHHLLPLATPLSPGPIHSIDSCLKPGGLARAQTSTYGAARCTAELLAILLL